MQLLLKQTNLLNCIHPTGLKQSKKETKPICAPEGFENTLSTTLLDAIEGFMLIVTSSGKIVYISDSVEKLLGHSQLDLMGQSLYTICHNGDHELLRHHLQPPSPFETKGMFNLLFNRPRLTHVVVCI